MRQPAILPVHNFIGFSSARGVALVSWQVYTSGWGLCAIGDYMGGSVLRVCHSAGALKYVSAWASGSGVFPHRTKFPVDGAFGLAFCVSPIGLVCLGPPVRLAPFVRSRHCGRL